MLNSEVLRFFREDAGQDLVEYALVMAAVALSAVAAMNGVSSKIVGVFTSVGTTLTANT